MRFGIEDCKDDGECFIYELFLMMTYLVLIPLFNSAIPPLLLFHRLDKLIFRNNKQKVIL